MDNRRCLFSSSQDSPHDLETSGYTVGDWIEPDITFSMSCTVKKGSQATSLDWYMDGVLYDATSSYDAATDTITNSLTIANIPDTHYNKAVKCVAGSSTLSAPLESSSIALKVKSMDIFRILNML